MLRNGLNACLARSGPVTFTAVAGLAGFCTYFSMYAFRKPFTAATFEGVPGWSFALDYKIALILAQVAGYALSKFIGVKVISEIRPERRALAILGLIGLSWLALVAFAVIPAPWNVVSLFVNGLPLGMIWGLVYGYMEGRRVSEVLASMMCASFILSSGVVKSVGVWLMQTWHVDRFWMPTVTGSLFMPLLLASVWVLSQLPPPSPGDEAARVRRAPMDSAERRDFLRAYAPGLIALVLAYVLLTAFRDFRDNFAAEIWAALGHGGEAAIFSASELPVAIIALVGMGAIIAVRDNRRALMVIHAMVGSGFVLLGLSTAAFQAHLIPPVAWMILAGSGLYLAYNPINAAMFDRLVAVSGRTANAGFLIYVADASGYMGSVALLLWRNFGQGSLDWLQFFTMGAYVTGIFGAGATAIAALYFYRRSIILRPSAADPVAWRPVRSLPASTWRAHSLAYDIAVPPPRLLDDGSAIEVELEGLPRRFHAIWLRDNARDAATRSPGNGQRLLTLQDIARDLRITEAGWASGGLVLRFEPEGKVVRFEPDWLLAHTYDKPQPPPPGWTDDCVTRWDAGLTSRTPSARYDEVRDDAGARREWLSAVKRYGFARLTGGPITPEAPLELAALFGYVRETNYGRAFDVRANPSPNNLADTNLGLQAHTDNPYRDPAPTLQVLACLENTAEGGESVVVDGFKVAERLQAETPRGFDLLTRHCARFAYAGSAGVRLRSKRPMIELGPDGELIGVRFNNRSAAAFTDIPYDDMADYYAAYRRMAELVEDPALAIRFRLGPGDMFMVDNQRVLHARTAFTGGGGRWLRGCYADRDGMLSTLAVLEEEAVVA